MEILFENEYCRIVVDNFGQWIRIDKILKTTMVVETYFDKNGKLIRK